MSCILSLNSQRGVVIALAITVVSVTSTPVKAQFFRNASVGGVKIDAEGVVSNPEVGELKELQSAWQKGLEQVPADLQKWTELRFVSLKQLESEIAGAKTTNDVIDNGPRTSKQLESEIASATAANKPIPEAVRYLAGLQRVRYVLIYPDKQDIVLAGPAEGWKVDTLGCVVGATTNRPVLTLDDLMVALRVAEQSNASGISCSIDPTAEGMQRMQQLASQFRPGITPQAAGRQMEEAVGMQAISVTGVPATSHFARVIVAADFRMKRLAMNFEPAPVDGMPSFLAMLKRGGSGANAMMPRFWLAANYDPIRRDNEGLAWELRGQGVRCLTEQGFLNEAGQKQSTGKADPVGQKWADTLTKKFEELAHEDSSFGQLRNVMDLAVVGALVAKERLIEKSGLAAPNLMGELAIAEFPAPRAVPSQASFVMAGRPPLVSVSGGVQIFPWQVASRTEVSSELAAAREQPSGAATGWYWQR